MAHSSQQSCNNICSRSIIGRFIGYCNNDHLQVRLDVFLIATIVISLLIISTATNFAVLSFAMIPLRDLSTALVNAAGQKIDQKLPNPSNKEYKATGFSDMLLSIYKEHTETSQTKLAQLTI